MEIIEHPVYTAFSSEKIKKKTFKGQSFFIINIPEKNVRLLMTDGLFNFEMKTTEKSKDKRFIELYFCLPNYWEMEDIEQGVYQWVFLWLIKIKEYIQTKNKWIGDGHTIFCGKSECIYTNQLKLNHLFITSPMLLENELNFVVQNHKSVHFLAVMPIFSDEMDYKQGKGTILLKKRLLKKGITEKLDEFRQSCLRNRWTLLR